MRDTILKASVTTYCTCEDYNEETDTYTPAESCAGYCGEDAEEWASELSQQWLDETPANDYETVRVSATGLGWTRARGYKLVKPEALEIIRALYLNGDFTVEFELDGDKLTARRWSHDEPMGSAVFTFERVEQCAVSYCEEIEGLKPNRNGELLCEFCLDVESVN
jgi:hypothetical protein